MGVSLCQYRHAIQTCNTDMQYRHAIQTCNTDMQYRHAIQTCNTDMQYRHAIQTCNTDMQYRHAIQTCNTDMQYRHAIQTCNTDMQYRHSIGILRAAYSGVEQQNVSSVNNSRCSDFSDNARDMRIVLYYIFVYYIFNFLELLALCTIQNDRLSNSKINACYYTYKHYIPTYTFLSNGCGTFQPPTFQPPIKAALPRLYCNGWNLIYYLHVR